MFFEKKLMFLLMLLAAGVHCSSAQTFGHTGPHVLVYKTKANYNKLVPVTLSQDKTKIVNYPAPHDIKAMGSKAKPTILHKGYLLDNRGISENTAFLSTTYDAYAALAEAPSMKTLMSMIVAKDPLVTLCDCGEKSKIKSPKAQINKWIDQGVLLKKCKAIKKP